ncbi:MAG: family 78 glycoside hydrolase catalytic domain [Terriglobia bacterium]
MTAFLLLALLASPGVTPANLRCESRVEPRGVDTIQPQLSWTLDSSARGQIQSAYQILVASSPAALESGPADLWDSGKVASRESIQIVYQGRPLTSHMRCYWRVRVWDKDGTPSEWSPPASWSMGILKPEEWHARWVAWSRTAINSGPLPMFRREFTLTRQVRRATVYICGLGYFELYLNGRKIGDDVLEPGWTNYRRTNLYMTYDVEDLLRPGTNAMGVLLGNGMYNVAGGRYVKFNGSFGRPKFILHLRIEYADGSFESIVSDERWKAAPGPIRFSCIYGGEDYDARDEQPGWNEPGSSARNWEAVDIVDDSSDRLISEAQPPIQVMQIFHPVKIGEPGHGIHVYDLGQNFAGWPQITVRGAAGSQVRLTPGELLDEKGFVTQRSSGGPTYFTYTLKGGGTETWHPRFSYYGFRYVQVDGDAELLDLQGQFLHSSAPRAGGFSCSNPLFNRIHELIDAAVRSNLQSVVTDCPHREKLGWLEVPYLMAPSLGFDFDLSSYFPKIVRDMRDSQTLEGLIPDTAPDYAIHPAAFRDSPEWGSAMVVVPWWLYRKYGDRRVLEESLPAMARYVDYLGTKAQDGIVSYGLGDWYDIGPGEPGVSKLTPLGVTATATYYQDLRILEQASSLLGHEADEQRYAALAAQVKEAFQRHFFDPKTGRYATGSQTAQAMPLVLNLCPPAERALVLENLVRDVTSRGNQQTSGDIGYHYLVRALLDGGHSDLLFAMTNRTDPPSYGAQLARGATSLTEAWDADPASSQNHCMLGHIEEWFYAGLAGIEADFDHITIKPQPVGDLSWVKAWHDTVRGRVESSWKIDDSYFELTVQIPANTTATVLVPGRSIKQVTENGRPVSEAEGVRYLRQEGAALEFEVASGKYIFRAPKP